MEKNTSVSETYRNRLRFLDNIKSLLVFLMILDHVSVAYTPVEGFPYVAKECDRLPVLWVIVCLSAGFIMGVFFFISGYFFPISYDRNGTVNFLKNKFLRLGIPFVLLVSANFLYLGRIEIYH